MREHGQPPSKREAAGIHPERSVTGQVLMSHASFEAERPGEAQAEQDYEQHRRAQHKRVHGSLDSYRPPRQFPCPGLLHVEDESEHMLIVGCTECSYETTCKSEMVI